MEEQKKINSYNELRQEVKKIWNLSQVVVVPVLIVALGVTSEKIERLTEEIRCKE